MPPLRLQHGLPKAMIDDDTLSAAVDSLEKVWALCQLDRGNTCCKLCPSKELIGDGMRGRLQQYDSDTASS